MGEVNTYLLGKTYNVVSNCALAPAAGITAAGPVVIKTIEMQPFNFSTGDIVTFEAVLSKQGSNGGYYHEVYWNTNPNLVNARKVFQSAAGPLQGTFIPATSTFSSIYFRMQIVNEFNNTITLDPTRNFITGLNQFGSDLFSNPNIASGNLTLVWETVGTQEGLASIDWTFWDTGGNDGGYFIVAGGVENSADRLRCEWIKISGQSSATFEDPVARLG
jgi:hypothetical protein